MSYTPINWQTGDTITAEKLNKMDNGWSVENTQLLSETITTAEIIGEGVIVGTFVYSTQITADTIIVTFDGTDYSCPRIDAFGAHFYGGFTGEGPDFSVYPFAIQSLEGENSLFTENAGTYTVAVVVPAVAISANFKKSVIEAMNFVVVPGVTTWEEVYTALLAGCNCYTLNGAEDFAKKEIILYALMVTESDFEIYGVTHNANNLVSVYYTATSADGVLS